MNIPKTAFYGSLAATLFMFAMAVHTLSQTIDTANTIWKILPPNEAKAIDEFMNGAFGAGLSTGLFIGLLSVLFLTLNRNKR